MTTRVRTIKQGEQIRAAGYLNPMERAIRELQQGVPNAQGVEVEPFVDGELQAGEVLQEISRKTSTVRVENPDDSEQYVDVERIDQLTVQQQSNGQILTFIFDNG